MEVLQQQDLSTKETIQCLLAQERDQAKLCKVFITVVITVHYSWV